MVGRGRRARLQLQPARSVKTEKRFHDKYITFNILQDVVYELHLLGGYADEAKRGHKLTQRFLKHLHDLPIRLEIVTCCLGPPNTKYHQPTCLPSLEMLQFQKSRWAVSANHFWSSRGHPDGKDLSCCFQQNFHRFRVWDQRRASDISSVIQEQVKFKKDDQ